MEGTVTISIHQYEHYKECEKLAGEIPTIQLITERSESYDIRRTLYSNIDDAMNEAIEVSKAKLEEVESEIMKLEAEKDSLRVSMFIDKHIHKRYHNVPMWIVNLFN